MGCRDRGREGEGRAGIGVREVGDQERREQGQEQRIIMAVQGQGVDGQKRKRSKRD